MTLGIEILKEIYTQFVDIVPNSNIKLPMFIYESDDKFYIEDIKSSSEEIHDDVSVYSIIKSEIKKIGLDRPFHLRLGELVLFICH